MRRMKSLQWRLSAGLATGLALLWLIAAIITIQIIKSEMTEVFDAALEETARRILPIAVNNIIENESQGLTKRMSTLRDGKELITYQVKDANGKVLMRSHDADKTAFPAFKAIGFVTSKTHRVYFDTAMQGSIIIAVAEPLEHRSEATYEALKGLLTPLLFLIPVSLFGVWIIVPFSLRPLQAFKAEIEARDSADLAPVSTTDLPTEMQPVAEAVNQLMGRLQLALASERSFTANSAHELRTPVAAALAQTQRLIAETDDPALRKRAEQVEQALRRLAGLSEKLMQLAKSEGSALINAEKKDVVPILSLVLTDFNLSGNGNGHIQIALPDTPVLSSIDTNAFAILARNLIENAVKHGDPDEKIRIELTRDGSFCVANGGAVIAAEKLETLTRPFTRGNTKASGTGLGLAIASTIASGSGGEMTIHSPAQGRDDGFEVVIRLP